MKACFQNGRWLGIVVCLGMAMSSMPVRAEVSELQLRRQEVEVFLHRSASDIHATEAVRSIGDVSVPVMSVGAILVSGFQFFDDCVLKGQSQVSVLETLSGGKLLAKVTQTPAGVNGTEICPEKIWVLLDQGLFEQWKTFHDKAQVVLQSPLNQGELRKAKEKATTLFKSYWVQQIAASENNNTAAYGFLCELNQGTQVVEISRGVYMVVSRPDKSALSACPKGSYVLNLRPERLF